MAISFPLPWSEFAGKLPIRSAPFRLRRFEQISWSGGSVPDVSELADARWSCRVALGPMESDDAAELQTLVELHGSAHAFELHDPARHAPMLDPTGALLGSATPTIKSVTADGVALQGLPAGYTLSRGDFVSILHGAASARALYRVAQASTANGAGDTGAMPLLPRPRMTAEVGQSAVLIDPTALMIILPDSFDPGENTGTVVTGMVFDTVEAW